MSRNTPSAAPGFIRQATGLAVACLISLAGCATPGGGSGAPNSQGAAVAQPATPAAQPAVKATEPAAQATSPVMQATQPVAQPAATPAPPPQEKASPAAKPAAPSSGATLDACSLLTKSEVEAAVGVKVADPKSAEEPSWSFCSFEHPQSAYGVTAVELTIRTYADPSAAKADFDNYKRQVNNPPSISGLGDDAIEGIAQVLVLKGRYLIDISSFPDAAGKNTAQGVIVAKGLAPKVVSRLP